MLSQKYDKSVQKGDFPEICFGELFLENFCCGRQAIQFVLSAIVSGTTDKEYSLYNTIESHRV